MDNKNLTTQVNNFTKRLTIQDLSAETIELSDKALSQIYGGGEDFPLPNPRLICIIFDPDSLIPGVSPYEGELSRPRTLSKTLKY